jgi:hypothetical protein
MTSGGATLRLARWPFRTPPIGEVAPSGATKSSWGARAGQPIRYDAIIANSSSRLLIPSLW